jgi:hypothetical protein
MAISRERRVKRQCGSGRLRIGYGPAFVAGFMPRVLARLKKLDLGRACFPLMEEGKARRISYDGSGTSIAIRESMTGYKNNALVALAPNRHCPCNNPAPSGCRRLRDILTMVNG